MSQFPIEADGLVVSYQNGRVLAVDNLALAVPGGQVTGILGGNGAGKSSTLRTLGGVLAPTAGNLRIAGFDMADRRQAEQARRVVGYCPDTGGLVRQATVREHIGVTLAVRGMLDEWPRAVELVDEFDLSHVLDSEAGGFSHGMSRRLSVLLAILAADKALILDEPFDGVDPLGVAATEKAIRSASEAGLAIVVSTHLQSLLAQICDRVCVMVGGRIVADGPASDFVGERGRTAYEQLLEQGKATR